MWLCCLMDDSYGVKSFVPVWDVTSHIRDFIFGLFLLAATAVRCFVVASER